MTNKCETCAFWEYFDRAEEDESEYEDAGLGTCKRRPPVFIGVQPDTRPYSPCNWTQPITTSMDGCGDWVPLPDNANMNGLAPKKGNEE